MKYIWERARLLLRERELWRSLALCRIVTVISLLVVAWFSSNTLATDGFVIGISAMVLSLVAAWKGFWRKLGRILMRVYDKDWELLGYDIPEDLMDSSKYRWELSDRQAILEMLPIRVRGRLQRIEISWELVTEGSAIRPHVETLEGFKPERWVDASDVSLVSSRVELEVGELRVELGEECLKLCAESCRVLHYMESCGEDCYMRLVFDVQLSRMTDIGDAWFGDVLANSLFVSRQDTMRAVL